MRLALAMLPLLAAAQPQYDLLLKGGRVIDAKNGVDAVRDVAVKEGRIAAVAANIPAAAARRTLDVTGLVVTPGIVDIHTHLFHTTGVAGAWAGDQSVQPDAFSFRTGVTTMADAGSSGWRNFETFRHTVIDRVRTRVFAFINIAGLGMMTDAAEQVPSEMNPEAVAALARKHKDVVVGVKSAHYRGPEWISVDKALEAGKLAGLPIMVDFGYFRPERPFWQLVTERLRPGDIATHCFRATVPWIDDAGKLYAYLGRARERGVLFDLGHGGGSFAFRNAVPAIAQGFYPDSISTDLHAGSMNAPMMDQLIVMSKMLVLGMPLAEVVQRSTWLPARIIHHTEVGHLSVGAVADIAALRVEEGDFAYADSDQGRQQGRQRLRCELTVKDGAIVWDANARGARDWREMPRDYGLRQGEVIVKPPR
jgi:dihydroorotase